MENYYVGLNNCLKIFDEKEERTLVEFLHVFARKNI